MVTTLATRGQSNKEERCSGSKYPVRFDVDYPNRDLNRLTTVFRVLWIIPIAIIAALVSHTGHQAGDEISYATAGGILVAPTV